jgi:hypothetical protein
MGYVHYTFSGQGDLGLRLKLLPVLIIMSSLNSLLVYLNCKAW